MDTPDIVHDLIPVILSICYIILAIDNWIRRCRDRRIERKIQSMWATTKVIGHPLSQGLMREIAELLGIELEN